MSSHFRPVCQDELTDTCSRNVHSLGITHRHLKPSNVLLDEEHHPLVCDFGSRRALPSDSTLAQSLQLTVYYADPEFGDEDAACDSKVDVYAFGVMLYEIVTGQLALRHLNQYQVMQFILRGKRPEISDKVLPFTRSLITRYWSGDPSERPSFSDIYRELWKHNFRIFEDVDVGAVASYAQSLSLREHMCKIVYSRDRPAFRIPDLDAYY